MERGGKVQITIEDISTEGQGIGRPTGSPYLSEKQL